LSRARMAWAWARCRAFGTVAAPDPPLADPSPPGEPWVLAEAPEAAPGPPLPDPELELEPDEPLPPPVPLAVRLPPPESVPVTLDVLGAEGTETEGVDGTDT